MTKENKQALPAETSINKYGFLYLTYVSIPDSSSLDISGNQISIEFWMKPTVDLPYPADNILIFDKGNAYTACIIMGGVSNGKCLSNLPFFGAIYSTTNFWNSGRWYYIAIPYDGSNMRIYVNGQLENTVATTGNVQPSGYLNSNLDVRTLLRNGKINREKLIL